jgi:hypothetical protein
MGVSIGGDERLVIIPGAMLRAAKVTSPMHEPLSELSGVHMSLDEYLTDFQRRFWTSRTPVRWKFERQQVFAEPGNESWRAFDKGDWNHALEILRERRGSCGGLREPPQGKQARGA